MKGYGFHFCPLDRTCRKMGAPARLYLTVFGHTLTVAFTPDSRMGKSTRQADGSWGPPYKAKWVSFR